jgi:hypothetical protein
LFFAATMKPIEIKFIGGPSDGGIYLLYYLPPFIEISFNGRDCKYIRWHETADYIYEGINRNALYCH